jgi:carboxyl-terminal processing protease
MRWKPFFLSTTLTLSLLVGQTSVVLADVSDENADTLRQIYQQIVKRHYSHPDPNKVLEGAIQGMLEVLSDPYTTYMTPQEYEDFRNTLEHHYAGIGAVLHAAATGEILITEVYAGTPAEQAGLQAGDRILTVDGQSVTGEKVDKVAALIRGESGTDVVLTIQRGRAAPQTITVTRQAIHLPTVTSQDMGNGVGYIRILSFGSHTSKEFFEAYEALKETSPNGILLDLRGNGGGYVLSALEIADSFLSEGTLLILHGEQGAIAYKADERAEDMPLVVLVDQDTASASEMLAGALQQNKRAKLVGTQTFGKGTMQEPFDLPNGGVLKLSVDQWALADGKTIDKVGLTPDIRLTSPGLFLNAALQQLLPEREQTLTLSRTGGLGELNGVRLLDVPAVLTVEGREYLPLRYVAEAFGSEVRWVPQTASVEFTLEHHAVRVELRTGALYIDNRRSAAQSAVFLQNGVSYLSTKALEEILGEQIQSTDTTLTLRVR